MKKLCASLTGLILFTLSGLAQNVAINEDGSLPNRNAILDVKSNNKGILIPRMSTASRMAIKRPQGLLVFDTNTASFWYIASVTANGTDTVTNWKNLATLTEDAKAALAAAAAWETLGNTADTSYFLGTVNNVPLQIKVNNQAAGFIDATSESTFWGYEAGFARKTADTPLTYNTAIGFRALYANKGLRNTATGTQALPANTTGGANTATGSRALLRNTVGYDNTAMGESTLRANTTGNYNTAVGSVALYNNVSGSFNTAIGYQAAASNITYSNTTAIGAGALVNGSNKVRIGNSQVIAIEGQVNFSVPSDGRFKFQVKEDVKGLDFILQLRPVTYQFDVKKFDAQVAMASGQAANYAVPAAYNEATALRRSGFIAQEVEKAAISSGYNFSGIKRPAAPEEHYSLSYEAFVVPLVKAVQELHATVQRLEQENKEMKQLLQKK